MLKYKRYIDLLLEIQEKLIFSHDNHRIYNIHPQIINFNHFFSYIQTHTRSYNIIYGDGIVCTPLEKRHLISYTLEISADRQCTGRACLVKIKTYKQLYDVTAYHMLYYHIMFILYELFSVITSKQDRIFSGS